MLIRGNKGTLASGTSSHLSLYEFTMDEIAILIVEDEKKIADTLKQGLSENGHFVEVAYDGNIGFKVFSSMKFDLVILDINLPGMNGYELCKAIRAINSDIPVIMLTAMSDMKDKVDGYSTLR